MQGEVMPGFDGVIQQRYPEIEKIDPSTTPAIRPASLTAQQAC
jgi:hypothetical protein